MRKKQTPIHGLIQRIEDHDIGMKAMRLVVELGVESVEDLAKYSRNRLLNKGYEHSVVDVLAIKLAAYQRSFKEREGTSSTYKNMVNKPTAPRRQRTSTPAGGAPPVSGLDIFREYVTAQYKQSQGK